MSFLYHVKALQINKAEAYLWQKDYCKEKFAGASTIKNRAVKHTTLFT